ncbi:hypothetical protein ON010_g19181 [Phytophthora cinnamomi]|nr:hypothetical protein ON010_g19181 [Phytophthora cinnamomi]
MRASPAHAPTLRQLASHTPTRLFNELLAIVVAAGPNSAELRLKKRDRVESGGPEQHTLTGSSEVSQPESLAASRLLTRLTQSGGGRWWTLVSSSEVWWTTEVKCVDWEPQQLPLLHGSRTPAGRSSGDYWGFGTGQRHFDRSCGGFSSGYAAIPAVISHLEPINPRSASLEQTIGIHIPSIHNTLFRQSSPQPENDPILLPI